MYILLYVYVFIISGVYMCMFFLWLDFAASVLILMISNLSFLFVLPFSLLFFVC